MFKRGRRDTKKADKSRYISYSAMMFMSIGGKEMTDLEPLKREEQDLLARKIMCHHQQNYLRGYGPTDSGGPLTPREGKQFLQEL